MERIICRQILRSHPRARNWHRCIERVCHHRNELCICIRGRSAWHSADMDLALTWIDAGAVWELLAISSTDLISWTSKMAIPDVHTCNTQVTRVATSPPSLHYHRYAMILEPFHFMLNNNKDGDLSSGWFRRQTRPRPTRRLGRRFAFGRLLIRHYGGPCCLSCARAIVNMGRSRRDGGSI